MRKKWIWFLSLVTLVTLLNNSIAQEANKITCTGKVVDAQGLPIAEATVKFYELEYDTTAYSYETNLIEEVTTEANGVFSFSTSIETNGYRYGIILAEKQGLAIDWIDWRMQEDQDVELKLGKPKELAGVVVDEGGDPITGGQVCIYMLVVGEGEDRRWLTSRVAPKLLTVKTDTAGKFAFTNLPPEATAEFLAKKTGCATVSTLDPTGYRGDILQFTPGQKGIKIEMPVEAKIEGIVVEKDTGKPVSDVQLMLMQERNRPLLGQEPIASNEDGTFSFNALTAGSHILRVVPPREELADWVAEPLEVATEAGKTTSNVKIEVCKGGILEVVVTEAATEKPVEKASINIRDEENDQWFHTQSDKDGIARIRLLAGQYSLSGVHKQGYSRGQQEETVTIEDNKTARLETQLSEAPKVTGVVRDESGKPVEGAKLKVCPMGGRDITSDAQGKFEVKWDPRQWGPEETVCYLVARQTERNLAAALEIEEDTKTADIKLRLGVIFTGKVVDSDGKGIANARITVMLRAARWGSSIGRDEAHTDEEGIFEAKAIPAEHRYDIYAKADGYGTERREVHADDAVDNQLDAGQFTLALANLSVSGIVVDVNDKPVANARLYCYGDGQPDHPDIQTDEEGKFTIEKVCEGRISVNANVRGKTRLYGYVETEGGTTDVKIVVTETGSAGRRFVPKQPPSLVGKPLPELKNLEIELSPADANDKMILVCFWDMQQRPSRHCIRQLAEKAEELKEKGITIIAVQASKVDENALNEWAEKYNITFPTGIIEEDEEKTRFAWGVRSLPWLILADKKQVVRAEGFALAELDEKLEHIVPKSTQRQPVSQSIEVGQLAPDFELPRLTIETNKDGKSIGKISQEKVCLSSFRGKKPVFLIFSSYT
ncbi:MAG: carboxypeptidase regulatory-like domain-containing protein [Planctomycetota bacterium]|jgi:protocatechuate 3,4-dioxygenase beta subunit/peroxiredoxin